MGAPIHVDVDGSIQSFVSVDAPNGRWGELQSESGHPAGDGEGFQAASPDRELDKLRELARAYRVATGSRARVALSKFLYPTN